MTQVLNGSFLKPKTTPITRIIHEVSKASGVKPRDIMGKRRFVNHTRARFVAMAICRDYLDMSYPAIGRVFDRDHSTVISAMRRVDALCADSDLDDMEEIARRAGLVEDA